MCKILLFLFIISRANPLDISDFTGGKQITTRQIIEETIEYFKTPDPYGIPAISIPEPMELSEPILVQSISMTNVSIYGHSKIRLRHFLVELERFEARVSVNIPRLEIIGDYVWPGYWSDSAGSLNITFIKMDIGFTLNLFVNYDGILQIENLMPSLEKDELLIDMTGLSAAHQFVVYAGNSFFDTVIFPFVRSIIESEVKADVNPRLRTQLADHKFPVDILPVDYFIAKLKENITRDQNLDPLFIKEARLDTQLPVSVEVKNITLTGLSSLHRRGTLSAEIVDDKIYIRFLLGTQELKLSCSYSVYSSIIYIMGGDIEFSVDELQVYVHVHQPVNIRYSPTLRKIDVELGNFILSTPGNSNVQYLMEFSVNFLANIFRNRIVDKRIEYELKEKIQNEFAKLELEKYIEEALDQYLPDESI